MTNKPMLSAERQCKECGSKSLSWDVHSKTTSGVPEGRLRSNEVQCLFVLGCNECSETVFVVGAERVAAELNGLRALLDKPAYPNRLCHTDHNTHPCICGCLKGEEEAQRRFDEHHSKSAHKQSAPVAYTTSGMLEIAKRLPLTGRIGAKATEDERWNIPLFLGQDEQPATVAPESACTSCDGSGEYTDAIGCWKGYCKCPAGIEARDLKGFNP